MPAWKCIAECTMPRCVSIAPLGLPVVPEVYRMAAVSSSLTAAGAGAGAADASSDANSSEPRTHRWKRECAVKAPCRAAEGDRQVRFVDDEAPPRNGQACRPAPAPAHECSRAPRLRPGEGSRTARRRIRCGCPAAWQPDRRRRPTCCHARGQAGGRLEQRTIGNTAVAADQCVAIGIALHCLQQHGMHAGRPLRETAHDTIAVMRFEAGGGPGVVPSSHRGVLTSTAATIGHRLILCRGPCSGIVGVTLSTEGVYADSDEPA